MRAREASEAGVWSQSAGEEAPALSSLLSFYFDTVFREQERRPPCHSPPTPRARRSPRSRARTAAPGGLMRCTAGTWSTFGNTQKILERSVSKEENFVYLAEDLSYELAVSN